MKPRFSFKLTSLLLAFTLLLAPALSVSALAADQATVRDIPEIYVHGIMSSTVLADKNDPNSREGWPMSADDIIATVKSIVPALLKFSATWNWDALADSLIPAVQDLFRDAMNDENGDPVGNTGIYFVYPSRSSITRSSKLTFRYDWRMDPIEVAAQLNDFIDYVLECSGSDKVTITCHSLGGIMTLSYLTIYGSSKVRSVLFNTTAIYGETYTGELLSGDLKLNAKGVVDYLKYAVNYTEYDYLISSLLDIFQKAGLMDFITKFGNFILEKLSPRVVPEILVPMFAGWLTIWAMVPDEDLDDCMHYVFDVVYKDSPIDFTGLKDRIEEYNTRVRQNKTQTLLNLNNNKSFNLYVFSRYGYSSLPLTSSYRNLSDGVIDTKNSSFGATTALYGEKLSDDVLNKADPKYISPDRSIDASTCLFPDQTWFIRNYKHSDEADNHDEITDKLLYSTSQATVTTFKEYPQFLQYNGDSDTISTDLNEPVAQESFFEKLKRLFEEFRKLFKSLFASLIKK